MTDNTQPKAASSLTPRDQEIITQVLLNLKAGCEIQVDYAALAKALGLKNSASAVSSWASVKKKLFAITGGGDGSGVASSSPAKPKNPRAAKEPKTPTTTRSKKADKTEPVADQQADAPNVVNDVASSTPEPDLPVTPITPATPVTPAGPATQATPATPTATATPKKRGRKTKAQKEAEAAAAANNQANADPAEAGEGDDNDAEQKPAKRQRKTPAKKATAKSAGVANADNTNEVDLVAADGESTVTPAEAEKLALQKAEKDKIQLEADQANSILAGKASLKNAASITAQCPVIASNNGQDEVNTAEVDSGTDTIVV